MSHPLNRPAGRHFGTQVPSRETLNRHVFSMKMNDFQITASGPAEVVLKCGAQNAGFSDVSHAAFQHHFIFSRATSTGARTCAGENRDFQTSLARSMSKCGRQTAFFSGKSQVPAAR